MQGIILFAHGSRDPLWHRPMEEVAQRIRVRHPAMLVSCAYLELSQPDLASAAARMVQAGAVQIRALPMFLGAGKHVREDLPLLIAELRVAHPEVLIELLPPVGEDPRLLDLMATIATS